MGDRNGAPESKIEHQRLDRMSITMTRPHRLNALDSAMPDALVEALAPGGGEVRHRPGWSCEGEGKAFSAGGDLDRVSGVDRIRRHAHVIRLERSVGGALSRLDKPTVSYVHGACRWIRD